ncbi:MAG TPA: hypothetical protein VHL31_23310 [Geminicoccus sp.]|jgi:hypothetical protein|uniref:tetratricopeptide repeat protein n=1 Tax=Geminicoccus sp. TaxID=2024832 RepID=UPI002E36B61A|nr:hypothetical protein [Geminicoccus sp.]HEX2529213.1 hypothetical protein [Geminicoccus sp.]
MTSPGLSVCRVALLSVVLGLTSACGTTWTPESGKTATAFNVPPAASRAFERARRAEKSGDRYGATMNYDEAAQSGHPMVLLFEARYYLRGPDNRDPVKAKAALERAVLVPSEWQADSAYLLGKMLVRGDGVPVEMERGQQLLQMAADGGAAGAAAELARTLERNGSTDTARIDALWAEAAEVGDEQAMVRVAERELAKGKTREQIPEASSRAMASLQARAADGDVNAMRSLARIYRDGSLAPADEEQALYWLEQAAEAGDTQSATRLAAVTRGTGRDAERLRWLTTAAEAGDPRAAGGLAAAYLNGEGVTADPQKAQAWAARAIEGGDTAAMAVFGRAYVEGRGVPKDVPRGLQMLEEAAAKGDPRGAANLARLYLRAEDVPADPEKAAAYAEAALAAADDVSVKTAYGRALLEGETVPADAARGIELLTEAAAAGDPLASTQLGIAYLDGNGVSKDVGAAVPLLQAGADAGNASAMNRLAQVLMSGDSTYGHMPSGIAMLEAAAEARHPSAQADLGRRLLTGNGVTADPEAGVEMLMEAADAGHPSAMITLGRAYLEGTGVPQDLTLAREWLTRAKAAGRDDADRLLARLPAS